MRTPRLILLATSVVLSLPATAAAGTVGIDADALHYEAAPGEFNELSVMLQSGRFTIQDGTSGTRDTLFVTALSPCEHDATPQPSPNLTDAYCPPAGVTRIAIDLGDLNDSVSIGAVAATDFPATVDGGAGADRIWSGPQADDIHGGAGNDTLTGNGGRDTISGDDGDDTIEAADTLPDRIVCGPGFDSVTADPLDTVADDCELTKIGSGEPQHPMIGPAPTTQQPEPTTMNPSPTMSYLAATSLSTLRSRGLRATVTCPPHALSARRCFSAPARRRRPLARPRRPALA